MVKRWDVCRDYEGVCREEDPEGEYVLSADYDALAAACEVHKQDAMREVAEANALAAKCDALAARLSEANTKAAMALSGLQNTEQALRDILRITGTADSAPADWRVLPCGCQVCTCRTDECRGCGAKQCTAHSAEACYCDQVAFTGFLCKPCQEAATKFTASTVAPVSAEGSHDE